MVVNCNNLMYKGWEHLSKVGGKDDKKIRAFWISFYIRAMLTASTLDEEKRHMPSLSSGG